ncbi:MAG: hypothetical protein ABSE50_22795 [Xanthobacteraceae bacterium]
MARKPSDRAERMSKRDAQVDEVTRENFTLPVELARAKAREIISLAPQGGHLTIVEQWRQQPDGQIQLTLRRLRGED